MNLSRAARHLTGTRVYAADGRCRCPLASSSTETTSSTRPRAIRTIRHDPSPATPLRRYERSSRGLTSGSPRPLATAEPPPPVARSEEHTSELQSHSDLVCRLLP